MTTRAVAAPEYKKVRDPVVPDAAVTYLIPLGNGRFGRWTVDMRDADDQMDAEVAAWVDAWCVRERSHLRLVPVAPDGA